jgi:hypothetical protein
MLIKSKIPVLRQMIMANSIHKNSSSPYRQAGEWGLCHIPIKKVNHHAEKDSCHLTDRFVGWRNNRLR